MTDAAARVLLRSTDRFYLFVSASKQIDAIFALTDSKHIPLHIVPPCPHDRILKWNRIHLLPSRNGFVRA
jgi:hypothetical protein